MHEDDWLEAAYEEKYEMPSDAELGDDEEPRWEACEQCGLPVTDEMGDDTCECEEE